MFELDLLDIDDRDLRAAMAIAEDRHAAALEKDNQHAADAAACDLSVFRLDGEAAEYFGDAASDSLADLHHGADADLYSEKGDLPGEPEADPEAALMEALAQLAAGADGCGRQTAGDDQELQQPQPDDLHRGAALADYDIHPVEDLVYAPEQL